MKKILKLFTTAIIFLIIFAGFVLAKENQSMNVALLSNKKSYKVGDEILINISIQEIEGFSGLNTFLAKKVFDEESLEYIGVVVTNNNWEVLGDAEKVLLRKMEGEDLQKGEICTLKFKALKEGNTTVQITEIDACNDDGDVYYEDGNVNSPSIEINIKSTESNNSGGNSSKSYLGIILIVAGVLGLIGVGIHYKKHN